MRTTWWKRGAVTLFVSAALTGGLVALGGSPAVAAKAMVPCEYQGETYPHGSIIQDARGTFMTCYNGHWIRG